MEENMVGDNRNEEEEVEYTFTAYEIDIDYEFDAARFFDFVRNESQLEVRQAETWFESAGSYPPSPFVLKLVHRDEALRGNVNFSPKSKGVEDADLMENDSDIEVDEETFSMDSSKGGEETTTAQQIPCNQRFHDPLEDPHSGLTLYNQIVNKVNDKNQTKSPTKPSLPRMSTLMKPTASQLAKQNRTFRDNYPRANTSSIHKANIISTGACGIDNQAAKRQKLASGFLRKVQDAMPLQQTNFIHKAPKRGGSHSGSTPQIRTRSTIPREPDLKTADRAHRTRPNNNKEVENATPVVRRFKALPLNRKILEAPQMTPKRTTPCMPSFREFHLKTSERATQHDSAFSKSRVHCENLDEAQHKHSTVVALGINKESSSFTSTKKPVCSAPSHSFKARPLNKKILTSKGDIGVFRNFKKETTVPMEFNFQSGKKSNLNPPIDLFNKLSLSSEKQETDSKLGHSAAGISLKGPKENRGWCQQWSEMKQLEILRNRAAA